MKQARLKPVQSVTGFHTILTVMLKLTTKNFKEAEVYLEVLLNENL